MVEARPSQSCPEKHGEARYGGRTERTETALKACLCTGLHSTGFTMIYVRMSKDVVWAHHMSVSHSAFRVGRTPALSLGRVSSMRQPPLHYPSTAAQAAGGPSSHRALQDNDFICGGENPTVLPRSDQTVDIGGWGSLRRGSVRDSPSVAHSNAFTPRMNYHSRWGSEPHRLRRPQSACVP